MPTKKNTKITKSNTSSKKEAEKETKSEKIDVKPPEVRSSETVVPVSEPPTLEKPEEAEPPIAPDVPEPPTSTPPVVDVPTETASPTEDDDVFAEETSGSGKKLFLIFLIALVVGALLVGGYFFFMSQKTSNGSTEAENKDQQNNAPMEKDANKEATDEAMIEEETDKGTVETKNYTVQILNGSGTPGEAGAVKDFLEDTKLEKFSTGNASSFDYEETEVQMKETVPISVFKSIQDALSEYTVVEGDILNKDADYDIIIVVGQRN